MGKLAGISGKAAAQAPHFHGLDLAALGTVFRWRFEPARLAGQPVTVYYELTITFRNAR